MNWMIDGAHGDLYRATMGYPLLEAATDEWEIERNIGRKPRSFRNPFAGFVQRLASSLAYVSETIRIARTTRETVS